MTPYEVQVSDLAKGQLDAIRAWLRDTDEGAIVERIEEHFDTLSTQLEEMPTRYPRLRVDGQVFERRVAPMLWYRVIYDIDEALKIITVNSVIHERQDLRKKLHLLNP